MEQELSSYNEDRTRQLTVLLGKQRQELAMIDQEITNLGINVADLVDTMQDVHFSPANISPYDKSMLSTNASGRVSLISLQRSYSSNSIVANSNGTTQK